jgi:hypothetical protein
MRIAKLFLRMLDRDRQLWYPVKLKFLMSKDGKSLHSKGVHSSSCEIQQIAGECRCYCRTAVPGTNWAMRACHSAGPVWWTLVSVTWRRKGSW